MHHVIIIVRYCHYCNVDFVVFHNIMCYSATLILVNTTYLLNITCALVATSP